MVAGIRYRNPEQAAAAAERGEKQCNECTNIQQAASMCRVPMLHSSCELRQHPADDYVISCVTVVDKNHVLRWLPSALPLPCCIAAAAREAAAAGGGGSRFPISAAAGVSWRMKAVARAGQLAKEQGRDVNEVCGSLHTSTRPALCGDL